MTFLGLHRRQVFRKFRVHAVPAQVYACIIFQIPVYTGGDVDIAVATYHYLLSFLIELEEIFVASAQFKNEL